jgi:hypothetical protein
MVICKSEETKIVMPESPEKLDNQVLNSNLADSSFNCFL